MGHSSNKRKRQNQPKEEALDTTEDKSLKENEQPTEETEETGTKEEMERTQNTAETTAEEAGAVEGIGEEEEKAETETEEKPEGAKEVTTEALPEEEEKIAAEEKEEAGEEERKREEIPEEEIVEERIFTIPLSRAWIAPRKKRAPRAMSMVKAFVQKHMKIEAATKTEEEEEETGRLVVSEEVNRKLWSRGIEKPPRNLRVRAVKDKEGIVTLYLAEGD